MKAGLLNHRIMIQERDVSVDELGQPLEVWTTVKTLWANILHLNGVESLKADAQVSTVKASIRIRPTDGLTAAMRVKQGSTLYQIQAILPNLPECIDLVCEVVE